jgi:DNA-binding Lrp family transcriptional regulator
MTKNDASGRLALKTPERAFLQTLESEFHFSPRLAQEVLETAQAELLGNGLSAELRPGQIRLVVCSAQAPFGPPLAEADKVEVTLTVDGGVDDLALKAREGVEGLRRGRILRLLDEGLTQGGVLSQEDLARALSVDARTIRRDVRVLKAEGHLLHTRGQLKGVGRGQTHKVRIIELWLDREGYEQIARRMHHTPQAIKRYVQAFLRIVSLHEQGLGATEIGFLTQQSARLVEDYLAVHAAAQRQPHRREKLAEELARVRGTPDRAEKAVKKGLRRQARRRA